MLFNKKCIVLSIIISLVLLIPHEQILAEENEIVEVEIKYTNGDRADFNDMEVKIFQDFDKVPILEKKIESNPEKILLPINHRYKIEVYVNGMYADVGYIQLNNNPEKLNIIIPLSGGLKFEVYYKNGNPIKDATVIIKSQDNVEWRKGLTNDKGETTRYWIQSTTKQDEHYIADVYLGEIFITSDYPIKLQAGLSLDKKINTNLQEVLEELITVNLYSGTKKITSNDGNYKVSLVNSVGKTVTTSDVNFRGDAQFSNLKTGMYSIKISSENNAENKYWPENKIPLVGNVNHFNIYKHTPKMIENENPLLECNCIAFRLDDIQDYWLADTQIEMIKLFEEENIPLTIGVIGGLIGNDQKITSVIKETLLNNNTEISNHSWNNDALTTVSKETQEKYILDTNEKIFEIFGVIPTSFIPPQNLYNDNTVEILKENGFTHLTSHIKENSRIFVENEFHNIPATTETGVLINGKDWVLNETSEIESEIIKSINQKGYAIIMMHPQGFTIKNEEIYAEPNQKALLELKILLGNVSTLDSKFVKLSEIKKNSTQNNYQENTHQTPINNTNVEKVKNTIDTCNCVSFRLDGVQDYWLNNIQIEIMNVFIENKIPLTVGIIADAFGNDQKITSFVKENTSKNGKILEVATKGIGLTPYTNYDKDEQNQNLKESIERIESVVGVAPHIFIPPSNVANSDTLKILEENKITHISTSLVNEENPTFALKGENIYRFPQITATGKFNPTSNIYEGRNSQQVVNELIDGVKNYGFGIITIQPQEFATVINSTYTNSVNKNQINELIKIIDEIDEKGYKIVPIGKINSNLIIVVPQWIKNNAGWWADGSIDDKTFVQGIEYLVKEKIIHVNDKSQTSKIEQNIPQWIKNNAGWWADGSIDDKTFVQGIEYLVKNGIILY
ncbi:hypothetical protein C5F49_04650 [Nitrosopumilus oxyclinae]|uniref:NodB homology domain-containing protein n=1 Tax=Nitrosopumilus oxyclinae TaxID=1959104 RepID=A0A7D5R3H8_9ARCH|nr:polysaccharide deacetylase family protein [Nitrosopumilus oxyclinae]QLH04677.1 hypothetical protein C5F49_04650 [Nitrosopumilus oxyclinae]